MLLHLIIMGKRAGLNPRVKRLLGTARVIAYGLVVSTVFGGFAVHSAIADVKTQGLSVGRELDGVSDLLKGANEIRLNDQRVFMAANDTDEPVKSVLDRFEGHCNRDPAFQDIRWRDLTDLKGKMPEKKGLNSLGVLREEDPKTGDGMVLCFSRPSGRAVSFIDAVRAFAKSGDLNDLGGLRYAHVAHETNGKTNVRAVWTEGPFDTRQIMANGATDAPGNDSALLPRPADSIRRFTAEAVGTPFSARIYETTQAPEAALKSYDAEMDRRGWLIIDAPNRDQQAELGRWYAHDGVQAAISIRQDGGGKTTVMIGEMGAADKTPTAQVQP